LNKVNEIISTKASEKSKPSNIVPKKEQVEEEEMMICTEKPHKVNVSQDDASLGLMTSFNSGQDKFLVATDGTGVANAIVAQVADKIEGVAVTNSGAELFVSSKEGGVKGNSVYVADGGSTSDFSASFQVGANKGQSFTISVGDMRSKALGITADAGTAGFTNSSVVTDGTNSKLNEAALDVSTHSNAANAIQKINDAIEKVSAQRSQLGSFQNRLEHTITNLGTASENLTAAESRVRDVDMAKEMIDFTKNNILAQAAQAMMAQANQQPQGVLQLLR